jgi:hypothetical protein
MAQEYMKKAQELAKSYGMDDKLIGHVAKAAEENRQMLEVTPEKQAVYDAYQTYYKNQTIENAKNGVGLYRPNEWKQSIYDQASANLNPNDNAYYQTDNIMNRQTKDSSETMARYNRLLESQAQAQVSQAEAGYAQARDQQIAELQKTLNQAVLDGQLSVKQAEQQFEAQKKQIQAQSYQDQEVTSQNAQAMGIQNSQQMLGMMASDQARNQSLNNDNMTARDMKIYEINNRLNAIKSSVGTDMATVNSNYNHAVTQAQSQIMANMYGTQYETQLNEYNRLANLQAQFDQMGLSQKYNKENMAIEQGYNLQNMEIQQQYALAQMSQQQRYTLEQFAVQQGYDLQKMGVQQQYQLAQMAQQYGYDVGLQQRQQSFQASQAQLDRNFSANQSALDRQHQFNYASYQNQLDLSNEQAMYERQRTRENNAYNNASSVEYKLRTAQEKAGINSAMQQYSMQTLTDLQMNRVASLMESLPKLSGSPKQSEISAYNSAVSSINNQIKSMVGNDMYQYLKIPTYQSSGTTTKTTSTTSSVDKYQRYYQNTGSGASSALKGSPTGF